MRHPLPNMLPSLRLAGGCLMLLATLTACDKAVDGSQAAASVTQRTFNDAVGAWDDVFTYHPKAAAQGPQTRYCYQLQSDVVCYDSIQTSSTSKLIGYQDGDKMSWVQPGGGSLGASGGPAIMATTASANRASDYSPAFVNSVELQSNPLNTSISSNNLPPSSH